MPKSIYALTADELAPDILLLLKLFRERTINEATLRQVLKGACWWISNAQGRKDACDLWSKKARALRQANPSFDGLGLIHEHIVPRSSIEEAILALEQPTLEDVTELLKHSRVCVVTQAEDELLRKSGLQARVPVAPSLSEGGDLRYLIAGIEFSEEPDAG